MENSQTECAQQGIRPRSEQLHEGGRVIFGIGERLVGLEKSVDRIPALLKSSKNLCANYKRILNSSSVRAGDFDDNPSTLIFTLQE